MRYRLDIKDIIPLHHFLLPRRIVLRSRSIRPSLRYDRVHSSLLHRLSYYASHFYGVGNDYRTESDEDDFLLLLLREGEEVEEVRRRLPFR